MVSNSTRPIILFPNSNESLYFLKTFGALILVELKKKKEFLFSLIGQIIIKSHGLLGKNRTVKSV